MPNARAYIADHAVARLETLQANPKEALKTEAILSHATITEASASSNDRGIITDASCL